VERLSHIDDEGSARMVDVSHKQPSARTAKARAVVRMQPRTAALVAAGELPKGDVITTARLAGIQAAKRTAELIPLCHNITLSFVDVTADVDVDAGTVTLVSEARTTERTGVEMEALTACSVAALTVYDMIKAVEREARVESLELLEKTGGKSDFGAAETAAG
jgi:cyclic pyranopterin phosphate synthase